MNQKKYSSELNNLEQLFRKNSDQKSNKELRTVILREKLLEYKCQKCGNDGNWQNEQLTLQLHHIDGDKTNNELSNLIFLCPNCHSQTDNFAGKNVKEKEKKIYYCKDCHCKIQRNATRCIRCAHKQFYVIDHPSRAQLKEMIRTESFVSLGRKYNVSDKTISNWCKIEGLPYRKKDIKNYSDEEWNNL